MSLVQRLRTISRTSSPESLATRLRKKRFTVFEEMVRGIRFVEHGTLSVADFGGTATYWYQVYDMARNPLNLDITLINYRVQEPTDDRFKYLQADVRDLKHMPDDLFHIAFSNSLIEHLGDLSAQAKVVSEMLRVSTYLYLQTPSRAFFWEPHYALPFVHWLSLPARMKVLSLVTGSSLKAQYDAYVNNPVRLLSISELRYLCPPSEFDHWSERVLGMTKSWVVRSSSKAMESV